MLNIDFSGKTIKLIRANVAHSFKVPYKDLPRVLFHGILLANIIAGFWLLDSLKDPVIANTIGMEYQPMAKIVSVFATLVIVCLYDFLTSVVSKPTLFHLVSCFFGLITMVIAAVLADPSFGLPSNVRGPHRMLGWFAFCTIEAYGSLMVALFWSFTNSIMDLEQAKGAYGLIIAIAQVGAIIGSTLATNASSIGISQLFIISAVMIFSVSLLIKTYHLTFRDQITEAKKNRVRSVSENSTVDPLLVSAALSAQYSQSNPSGTKDAFLNDDEVDVTEFNPISGPTLLNSFLSVMWGFSEGLVLLLKYPYMLKLLGVSCLYEVVVTILDYQFKVLGSHSALAMRHNVEAGDGFAQLLGHFGQATNVLSFFLSFFGFSYLVHTVGVRQSLLIFPAVLLVAVVLTNLVPTLTVLFVTVSCLKAMIFSLQDPIKELLYIPTSEVIKFKAKAWIDVFGSRLAKAGGSTICSFAGANAAQLRRIAEIPCLVIAAGILVITWSIGFEFQELVTAKTFIGAESDPDLISNANHIYHVNENFEAGYKKQRNTNCSESSYSSELELSNNTGRTSKLTSLMESGVILRNGLKPGEVGYDGYDLHLFEGVFEEDNPLH
jgi:ATP:ADP antiporter, AAA family